MDVTEGKDKIEAYVTILSAAEDIAAEHLSFKWSLAEKKPRCKSSHDGIVYSTRIHLGKKSQALVFSECEIRKSITQPELFLLKHKDEILNALRKLKLPKRYR